MKRLIAVSLCMLTLHTLRAQQYWQQQVNYTMQVSLDDKAHSIKGNSSMEYINQSPDELTFIFFHLWPNAYKDKKTALYKQMAADKDAKDKLVGFKDAGYINGLDFKVNGQAAKTEADPENADIVKLLLPKPLAAGGKITITTPFFVKLPTYFSRMGHADKYYMITQWYPKPAVYDQKGWHPMPYLDHGEFYSEYGSFDISITLPSTYVVAATGNLQTAEELNIYKTTGAANRKAIDAVMTKYPSKEMLGEAIKNVKLNKPEFKYAAPTKTLRFTESNIHDFAWFACEDFVVQYDVTTAGSNKIDVFTFHHPESTSSWYNSTSFVKDAVKFYSDWLGDYPYSTVKALEGPRNQSSGGMEYPTVTLITSPDASQERLDAVITHEVGHNWLYGILGSNERNHPWMDEGINSYIQFRYEAEKYRTNSIFGDAIPEDVKKLSLSDFQATIYNVMDKQIPMEGAIETSSEKFANKDVYGTVVYIKTALWMYIMEVYAGEDELKKALKAYYSEWKFKHPYPEDFRAVLEREIKSKDLGVIFSLLKKKEALLKSDDDKKETKE